MYIFLSYCPSERIKMVVFFLARGRAPSNPLASFSVKLIHTLQNSASVPHEEPHAINASCHKVEIYNTLSSRITSKKCTCAKKIMFLEPLNRGQSLAQTRKAVILDGHS